VGLKATSGFVAGGLKLGELASSWGQESGGNVRSSISDGDVRRPATGVTRVWRFQARVDIAPAEAGGVPTAI
jgi:hypothetical protein